MAGARQRTSWPTWPPSEGSAPCQLARLPKSTKSAHDPHAPEESHSGLHGWAGEVRGKGGRTRMLPAAVDIGKVQLNPAAEAPAVSAVGNEGWWGKAHTCTNRVDVDLWEPSSMRSFRLSAYATPHSARPSDFGVPGVRQLLGGRASYLSAPCPVLQTYCYASCLRLSRVW